MPQACSVCSLKDRAAVDRMLVEGVPLRRIAEQSGTSVTALHRHKAHVPATLATAKQAEQVADAGTLLSQVQTLLSQAKRLTDAAEHAKDLRTALTGCRAIGSTLELLGKVSGQLTSQINVTGNLSLTLKAMDDAAIRSVLWNAGRGSWLRRESFEDPAANEPRIAELLQKAGGVESFLSAGNASKPN